MGIGIFLAKRALVCVKICMSINLSPLPNGTSGSFWKICFLFTISEGTSFPFGTAWCPCITGVLMLFSVCDRVSVKTLFHGYNVGLLSYMFQLWMARMFCFYYSFIIYVIIISKHISFIRCSFFLKVLNLSL